MSSSTNPPKRPEKPPWANSTPMRVYTPRMVPIERLKTDEWITVLYGIEKLNPRLFDAIENGHELKELDVHILWRYFTEGEKIKQQYEENNHAHQTRRPAR